MDALNERINMFLITYRNKNEEDAKDAIEQICNSLKGWKAYINNEVTVSPLKQYDERYGFNIWVGPEDKNQQSAPWIEIDDFDICYRKK